MVRNRHFDRLRQIFADQFEPDGAHFLYRKSQKGAAFRVSATDRDAFVEAFGRGVRLLSWSLVGAVLLLIMASAVFGIDADSDSGTIMTYGSLGLAIALFWLGFLHIWNAPMRALERDPEVDAPLDRSAARRLALSRISHAQLGGAAAMALVLLWAQAQKQDVLHGWGLLWSLLAAAMMLGAAVQAFRKWRLGSE